MCDKLALTLFEMFYFLLYNLADSEIQNEIPLVSCVLATHTSKSFFYCGNV